MKNKACLHNWTLRYNGKRWGGGWGAAFADERMAEGMHRLKISSQYSLEVSLFFVVPETITTVYI